MDKTGMPKHDPKELKAELAQLEIKTGELTRNYSIEAWNAMQGGEPREGAAGNERMAREKFARMRKIEMILNTLEWLEPK